MSYRCELCNAVVPERQSRLVHRITKPARMTLTYGSQTIAPTSVTTSSEVSVCSVCCIKLQEGSTVASLYKYVDRSAPPYRMGRTRVVLPSDLVIKLPPVETEPAPPEDLPESGVMIALFRKYGAQSYWLAKYDTCTAEYVCNQISPHFHLRKLFNRLLELVPSKRRKHVDRPKAEKPALFGSMAINAQPLKMG